MCVSNPVVLHTSRVRCDRLASGVACLGAPPPCGVPYVPSLAEPTHNSPAVWGHLQPFPKVGSHLSHWACSKGQTETLQWQLRGHAEIFRGRTEPLAHLLCEGRALRPVLVMLWEGGPRTEALRPPPSSLDTSSGVY